MWNREVWSVYNHFRFQPGSLLAAPKAVLPVQVGIHVSSIDEQLGFGET